jgi:hypothetical protein
MTIETAARAATDWWTDRLQTGDRERFAAALFPLVLADLAAAGECSLVCDYDPLGHLLIAVRAAGLECSGMGFSASGILPAKHSLEVYPDRLEPKEGYGNWLPAIAVPE